MFNYNYLPPVNRERRRKVERYMRKHPGKTFTQAFNEVYHTDFSEPPKNNTDTSIRQPEDPDSTSMPDSWNKI